ncbi:MAG: biopolymer transporter ExbD [Phycisphaerales bacterium]|nr:biopolymer transporter ExbD [Phycisphaerales bacterium]
MRRLSTRRNAAAQFDLHYGPNMTPMVDVTLVILIFFMASAAFLGPEWFVKAALPVRGSVPATQQQLTHLRVVLTRAADGSMLAGVGDRTGLTTATLEAFIASQALAHGRENVVVVVEPAPDVSYDAVVRVHEICARAGVRAGLAPESTQP